MGQKSMFIKCDVGYLDQVQKMMEQVLKEFGKVDILVNNAGITRDKLFINMNEDQWDEEFNEVSKTPPGPENALKYLNYLPGYPDFPSLLSYKAPVNTIIINGIDKDLLITTNQLMVQTEVESLKEGVEHLKKITRTNRVIIAVPPDLASQAEKTGAEVPIKTF